MDYKEEDWLQLSGLQHFAYCKRQWALITLENQWSENLRTTEGHLMHERAHDDGLREKRGDTLIVRGLWVHSVRLGVSGQCDVVEFHRHPSGVPLDGETGLWLPTPVEYKRGRPKTHDEDRLQLCCQAMCLEEMLLCEPIATGYLYYGQTTRRETVALDRDLRDTVEQCLEEMHRLAARKHTPKVKPNKGCNACSLKETCLPFLMNSQSASAYVRQRLRQADPEGDETCEN
jgi:CRISPR-associated exonuclease Cas4